MLALPGLCLVKTAGRFVPPELCMVKTAGVFALQGLRMADAFVLLGL